MYKERKKIAKKTFGNFPFISVIFSVTLSLLLLGLFSFFLLSSFNVKNYLESNTEINIYLNKKISPSQIEQIKRTLYTKEYSLTNTESTLNYVSSEEAAKNFQSEIGEDFVDFLGNNPLRDLIILKINSMSTSPITIKPEIRDRIKPKSPLPINKNISLYSLSTDLVFEPISPFFNEKQIFLIAVTLSNLTVTSLIMS